MKKDKVSSSSALFWDLLRSVSQQEIGFIISIVLARLLMPEEFALVGTGLAAINVIRIGEACGRYPGAISFAQDPGMPAPAGVFCGPEAPVFSRSSIAPGLHCFVGAVYGGYLGYARVIKIEGFDFLLTGLKSLKEKYYKFTTR